MAAAEREGALMVLVCHDGVLPHVIGKPRWLMLETESIAALGRTDGARYVDLGPYPERTGHVEA